ncbi:hypothetical protein [Caulobacter sp. B11]|uniref:hypothetical protein n=1 Tax=Caulobacter sp. B11 TaxID=2048899 RepID=UPI001F3F217A|nr:hypothetical protein [Caulobacter sp. B11]
MISLLLVMAGSALLQEEQAKLQSCEMTPTGWVCHYQMPAVTLSPGVTLTPDGVPPPVAPPQTGPRSDTVDEDAGRQARLIARCADASWMALCLPGDRREARRLREAAEARDALRGEVTRLLSENQCPAAVKAALAGGDLALAKEARDFCKS